MKVHNISKDIKAFFINYKIYILILAVITSISCIAIIILPNYFNQLEKESINTYKQSSLANIIQYNKIFSDLKNENTLYSYKKDIFATTIALKECTKGSLSPQKILQYADIIVKESKVHHIDPILVVAVVYTESRFKNNARSNRGAKGLMQLLPNTANYIHTKLDKNLSSPIDLFNPEVNLSLGIAYLDYLLKKTNGNLNYALAAYNMGPANLYKAISNSKVPTFYSSLVLNKYKELHNAISKIDISMVSHG